MYFGIKVLLFQLIPYGFYPPADIFPGDFRTDGFFQRHVVRCKILHPAESCIEKGLCVAGFSCYQLGGNKLCLCPSHDPFGKLAHECLAVGMSFTGNYEVGICQQAVETGQIKQKIGS